MVSTVLDWSTTAFRVRRERRHEPQLTPGPDQFQWLQIHPESLGDPGEVVKQRDDLRGIVQRSIVETLGAESVEVGLGNLRGTVREPGRLVTEGPIHRRDRCAGPVAH